MTDRTGGRHRRGRRGAVPFVTGILLFVFAFAAAPLAALADDHLDDAVDKALAEVRGGDAGTAMSTDTDTEDAAATAQGSEAEAPAEEPAQEDEAADVEEAAGTAEGEEAAGTAEGEEAAEADGAEGDDDGEADDEAAGGNASSRRASNAQASATEPGPATTTLGVQPQVIAGNPDCADLLGGGQFLFEHKTGVPHDDVIDLSFDGMSGTLTIDVNEGAQTFDFTFTGDFEAEAVIVKGGPNANFYDYRPEGAVADTGLHAPVNPKNDDFYGLSHISFCIGEAEEEEPLNPDIRLVKQANPTLVHVGDLVAYTFEVTNTGEEDLFEIELTDDTGVCDDTPILVDDADGDTTLSVDETWVYECTHVATEEDGTRVTNTATVRGENAEEEEVSDEDDAVFHIIHPAIDLEKSVSDDVVPAGSSVTYTFVVTNTGDTTLFDVVVEDDKLGVIGTVDELAPGDDETFSVTVTIGDAPVTNVAVARGTDVLDKTVTDQDSVTVTPIAGGGGGGPPPGPDTGGGGGGTPFTGSETGWLALAALVLLGAGAAIVAATRRLGDLA